MGRGASAALILGLMWMGDVPASATAQGIQPEVRRVEFEGNATFPADSLERAIATAATECRSTLMAPLCAMFGWGQRRSYLRERDVTLDEQRLERWYQIRGYREVSVETETTIVPEIPPSPEGRIVPRYATAARPPLRERVFDDPAQAGELAFVRFSIAEGRPILADSLGYVGPDGFDLADLVRDLPIQPGDRWSTLTLDATRDTLLHRLRNRGYPYADVLRQTVLPQDEPYHAHVTFEIDPGTSARYGDIRVAGIENLDESTVLRTLPFRTGDPYRVDQLFEGQARLFGLEIVRNAQVVEDTLVMRRDSTPDSVIPLFVQVNESDPYRLRAGAGWNTTECVNTEARWTSRNLLGGGRVFQLRGRLANIVAPCVDSGTGDFAKLTWLAAIDFTQPWIFSTRNSFSASVFGERQSVPDIFIRRAFGLQLALQRALAPRTPLTLSYRPELSTLTAAEELLCSGLLICTGDDIDILTGARRLAPVGVNLTRDLSDSALNPTEGYRLVLDLEHSAPWTGSEFRYNRAVVEGTWYSRVTGVSVFATRLRGGWVGWGQFAGGQADSDLIHPQKRFYAGGANSVRGFAQSRLGPRLLAVDDPTDLLTPNPETGVGECQPQEIVDQTCDANGLDGIFDPRPTGGTRVIEGNVELRFGLGREFELVTFGDFGQVWGQDQTFDLRALEFTPGVGLRYLSPVGPIRLDVGYNFRGSERLPVVTKQIAPCDTMNSDCLFLGTVEIPFATTGDLAVLTTPVDYGANQRRFQLHLSIGQAF
jgi:outer membrane protein insertion porin family/translocation and assembly module TamA